MIEVIVSRLGLDSASNAFVVILQEKDAKRLLPIWIGRAEAESIAAHLDGEQRARPMTHDLAQSLITALGGSLERVHITRVHEGTFFAEMHLQAAGTARVVDSRPSDAIAIALRAGAPIFAAPELLVDYESPEQEAADTDDSTGGPDLGAESLNAHTRSVEQLQRYLSQLRPEDFGKFRP